MLNGHLLGIYEKAFPQDWSLADILRAAKELGFDFVEISIDEKDERLERLDWDENRRTQLHAAMRETKMFFQSMCLSGHRRFPFGSKDETVRARAYDIMEKAVKFAHEFGIRVIQLAGYDVYYEKSTPESLELFYEGLRWSRQIAQKYQVMLAIEIMDTKLLNSISRYMEIKKNLPSPWLKVYPDCGNLTAWGNDVSAELEMGKDEIIAMHLKDTIAVRDDFPGKFKEVEFGSGCVNFIDVFKKMRELEYCGPYMIEMWHQQGADPYKAIRRAKDFIEKKYTLSLE